MVLLAIEEMKFKVVVQIIPPAKNELSERQE
jgi:hypothetical protein